MFVSNITPLIIVAGAMKMPSETKTFLIQCTMLVAGVNTLIQAYRIGQLELGFQLLLVQVFAFVPVALSIGSKYGYEGILGAALVVLYLKYL